jgi:hypothetical protein
MAMDKIEAVKNVSELSNKSASLNPAQEADRLASNREHFQSLMSSSQPVSPTSFERVDHPAAIEEGPEQKLDKNPIFADENVSSQKSGSATDQQNKKKQSDDEEVEGVSATRSKKKTETSASLMDEMGKVHSTPTSHIEKVSPESIRAQTKEAIAQIDQAKAQLSQATEIKPSYQTLLQNRLTHIDDNLKIALSKVGIEQTSPPLPAKGTSPVHRFINMLTNTQSQLDRVGLTVTELSSKDSLSPAEMLTLQFKIGHTQQQIELFTNLLNKALESTKTIMNVQV